MMDAVARAHSSVRTEGIISVVNRNEGSKAQSFASQLSDTLSESTKSQAEKATLPATLPPGQKIVTRPETATTSAGTAPGTTCGTSSGTSSGSTSGRTSGSAGSQPSGISALFGNNGSTTSGTSSSSSSSATTTSTTSSSESAFDQAYWASQPAAVQALQNIQDPNIREAVATELAQQGYTIDVPIMVWGWDPQLTTQLRQADGYTWVPSAEQQGVAVAPGLTQGGVSYDPSNPPPGSIMV